MAGQAGVRLTSIRQGRLNRRCEVFGGDAALEAGDHSAVLTHQELLEIPLHITGGIHLIEGDFVKHFVLTRLLEILAKPSGVIDEFEKTRAGVKYFNLSIVNMVLR